MPEIGDQVQRRIQTTFLAIANRQIPYNALNRNSNSSAFTVLERSIPGGRRPFPKDGFSVPAWDIDVFTGNRSNALRPIPNLDPFSSVCAICITP
ncbi:hypothetical protein HC928_13980 [bacterium]|nr:hypothetical protein [bacterium]